MEDITINSATVKNILDLNSLSLTKKVEKAIQNADVLCLTLPYFENGYKAVHEKTAFICVSDAKGLKDIIKFKNDISRKIELYQLRMSGDRYNGFNGNYKKKRKIYCTGRR